MKTAGETKIDSVPFIPESAPFSAEQRAYLNGFLAGLFARAPLADPRPPAIPTEPPLRPLTILFGSQSGTAETLAKRAAREAGKRGFAATTHDLGNYTASQLPRERQLLIVTSTFGDGDPPDSARAFWDALQGEAAPRLPEVTFSVCALGDTNYPKFCAFGKNVDARLAQLGARCVLPRVDCDVDYEAPFARWLDQALSALAGMEAGGGEGGGLRIEDGRSRIEDGGSKMEDRGLRMEDRGWRIEDGRLRIEDAIQVSPETKESVRRLATISAGPRPVPGRSTSASAETHRSFDAPRSSVRAAVGDRPRSNNEVQGEGSQNEGHPAFTRLHPFPAPLLVNRPLNRPGSQKEVRHFQLSLAGSGLNYEVGDALGVYPANCPGAVENIIQALRCQGDEPVPANQGQVISLREALLRHYEIKQIPPALLQCVAEKTGDANLRRLISPTANGETTQFLWGREIIDLLRDYPSVRFAPDEFTALLKKLAPRYYSIASSLQAHPGEVHLTVSVLRYECLGYPRLGVCSAYLADRIPADGRVPVFLQRNQNFRLPAQRDAPLIMVGPGTGIAPFRAFLQERRARGGRGRTWLFFGEQHAATDFLYQEELESFVRDGTLSRLATAFSRDQSDKLYVQHRMLEQQREIFAWLEDGAHFYVCGDARRMAKDVEATLRQIIVDAGGQTPEQAVAYLQQMRVDKRYQRDVY